MSTFFTYEIPSHEREGRGCINVENLIVLWNTTFLSFNKNVDCLIRIGREGVKKL